MPSVVKGNLNQCIRASLTAAEVIGSPRGFAGFAVNNSAGQKILIYGIVWSVLITNPADKPNIVAQVQIQRGLVLSTQTQFPAVENPEEMIYQYFSSNLEGFAGQHLYTAPIELEPGYPWAITLVLSPTAVIAGACVPSLTVLGRQANATEKPFPFVLR